MQYIGIFGLYGRWRTSRDIRKLRTYTSILQGANSKLRTAFFDVIQPSHVSKYIVDSKYLGQVIKDAQRVHADLENNRIKYEARERSNPAYTELLERLRVLDQEFMDKIRSLGPVIKGRISALDKPSAKYLTW